MYVLCHCVHLWCREQHPLLFFLNPGTIFCPSCCPTQDSLVVKLEGCRIGWVGRLLGFCHHLCTAHVVVQLHCSTLAALRVIRWPSSFSVALQTFSGTPHVDGCFLRLAPSTNDVQPGLEACSQRRTRVFCHACQFLCFTVRAASVGLGCVVPAVHSF